MGSPKNTPTQHRADIAIRQGEAPSTFDAGLHARTELGVFNVGLVVATQELAVVVKAPSLGTLHLIVDRSRPEKPVLSRALFLSVEGHEVSLIDGFVSSHSELGLVRSALDEIQSRLTAVEKERNTLTSQLAEARSDLELLAAAHQTQRHEAELELKRLGESAAAMELDKQASTDALRAELTTAANEVGALRQKERASMESQAALQTSLDQLTAHASVLDQTNAELTQQLAARSEAKAALQKSLDQLTAHASVLEQTNAELTLQLAARGEELVEAQKALISLEKLRTQLSASEASRKALTEELKSANASANELSATAAEFSELQQEHERLQRQLESQGKELVQLRSRANTHQSYDSLQATLREMERQFSDSKAASTSQIARLAQETSLRSELESTLISSNTRIAELEAQLEGLRAHTNPSAAVDVQVQLAATTADLDALRRSSAADMEAMVTQLQHAYDSRNELEQSLAQERERAHKALDDLRRAAGASAAMKTERDEALAIAKQLRTQIIGGHGVDGLKQEVKELRETLDNERALSAQLVGDREREELRAEALERDLVRLRAAIIRVNEERDLYRDRFRALTAGRESGLHRRPDVNRMETRSYQAKDSAPTYTEVPIVSVADAEPVTDPLLKTPKKVK